MRTYSYAQFPLLMSGADHGQDRTGCGAQGSLHCGLAGAEILPARAPLRERIPAHSGAVVTASAALVISALAGEALAYSMTPAALRRFNF